MADANDTTPTENEIVDAKKDGNIEAIKDSAKVVPDADILANDPEPFKYHGYDEIQMYAFWLDRPVDDIKKAHEDGQIPDAKLYGLLALERNGRNRTDYVKYIVDTLKLKDDLKDDQPLADALPGGGPSYTHDTTNITDL